MIARNIAATCAIVAALVTPATAENRIDPAAASREARSRGTALCACARAGHQSGAEDPELVLLAAYREDGAEMDVNDLSQVASRLGWRVAKRHAFASFADLVEHAKLLPMTEEGFVIRFSDGHRLKVKGSEYQRIHSLISRCTPLAMWDAMSAGDDLEAIRRDMPEEFWGDFDAIRSALTARIDGITTKVAATAEGLATATDKEVGLQLKSLDPDVRPLIFGWRKAGGKVDDRAKNILLRMIRPTSNALPGYVPSYAMNRIAEEMS
jgi:putative RNA ligase